MKVDVKFAESAESFKADFGEIKTASDGGYERGYADGYEAGYSKGSDTASLKKTY
jgi:flagellar biosynthesis/type III secretory pathway protein FliH